MSGLTYDEFRAIKNAMTVAEWERVKDKARWEQMTPWAVLVEWPSLRGAASRPAADTGADET